MGRRLDRQGVPGQPQADADGQPAGRQELLHRAAGIQVLVIWYNRKIFEKLGITVPKTYDDLKAAAKALTDGGYIPMFQGAADGWQNENVFLMLANQFSAGIVDKAQAGETPWTAPELVSAMTGVEGPVRRWHLPAGRARRACLPDRRSAARAGQASA